MRRSIHHASGVVARRRGTANNNASPSPRNQTNGTTANNVQNMNENRGYTTNNVTAGLRITRIRTGWQRK